MTDDDGWSALHFTAEAGNVELFQYLIEKGCDVYKRKRDSENCLHIAAWKVHLRLCKVLVKSYKFDIHTDDDNGCSVLHCAATAVNLQLFQYLVEKGCELHRTKKDGMNCLHIAAENGHLRLCKLLLENCKFDIPTDDANGCPVLHCVATSGNLELFQYLVEKGCDANGRKRDGMNCLHVAAWNGHLSLCEVLVKNYKFDIYTYDNNGSSVLHCAANAEKLELFQYLLEKGSELYRQKRDGWNCLHIAAENGHLHLCKVLLENYNFNLQMTDDNG